MSMLSIYRASGSASTCAASTSPRCQVQSCQNQSARRRGRFQCNSVYHLTFYGLPPFRTRDACTNYSCHKRTTEPNNTRRNWKQASKLCALPRSQDDATGANIVQELLKMEKEKLQHLDSVQLTQRLERIRAHRNAATVQTGEQESTQVTASSSSSTSSPTSDSSSSSSSSSTSASSSSSSTKASPMSSQAAAIATWTAATQLSGTPSTQASPGSFHSTLSREAIIDALARASLEALRDVVSFPLVRTPKASRSAKAFMVVPVDVEEVGFIQFLLDSGSSGVLITTAVREALGLSPMDGSTVKGVDSAGPTLRQRVALPPLRIGSTLVPLREAYVTSLKIDHDIDIGGVLGLSFLKLFEIDIDFKRKRISFHPVGHIDSGLLDVSGTACLQCTAIKGGLLAVPASLNGSRVFPAVLDIGANYSTINWSAARLAGFEKDEERSRSGGRANALGPMTQLVSADGTQHSMINRGFLDVLLGQKETSQADSDAAALGGMPMRSAPTTTSSGSSPGSESSTRSSSGSNAAGQGSSQMPPDTHTSFVPRIPMAVLVRDVPGFAALGYADVPMMVLGMDLLGQGRLVLQLASQRVFVQEPAEFDPEGQDNS